MTLFKRNNIWWTYVSMDGIRHHKSTGTSNRRNAETIDRQFREELNDAKHRLPKAHRDMTFGELSSLFIAEGMSKPYSTDRLKHLLPFFADMRLSDLNKSVVRKYRQQRHQEKTLTVATVNRDLGSLRRILYWGVEEGYLAGNPLGRLKMERERRTKRPVLSLREEKLLLAAAPEHLERIILCALLTGMRRGEILHQQWEDVDLDNRLLYVSHSKTPEGEMREIPLATRLYELLKGIHKERGQVFTYNNNRPLVNIKTTWAGALKRSQVRHFRFHDLRHTANTRMMLAGVMQEVRREILGHSSQRSRDINDRYTQIELPVKRAAIEKLELWLNAQEELLEAEEQNVNPAPPAMAEPQPEGGTLNTPNPQGGLANVRLSFTRRHRRHSRTVL